MKKNINSGISQITDREKIEQLLLKTFPKEIKPLTEKYIPIINKYKDGTFGNSYLGFMLYANGNNRRGRSNRYPQGLLFENGNTIFGIGFFKKNISDQYGHLHIISPRGKNWLESLTSFLKTLSQIKELANSLVYIRYLTKNQYNEVLKIGGKPIDANPWNIESPSEDETYSHCLLKLQDIIDDSNNVITVKKLMTKDSRNFRIKTKMAYNRFSNFLKRNSLKFHLYKYSNKYCNQALNIVNQHFSSLDNAIGSTAEDYYNLIKFYPKTPKKIFFAYIGFLKYQDNKIPVSLFIGEKIDKDLFALYATFALRHKIPDNIKVISTGYSAVSQYSYIRVFSELKKEGFTSVNLGGSETEDLDKFKRQLGAQDNRTFWVVIK